MPEFKNRAEYERWKIEKAKKVKIEEADAPFKQESSLTLSKNMVMIMAVILVMTTATIVYFIAKPSSQTVEASKASQVSSVPATPPQTVLQPVEVRNTGNTTEVINFGNPVASIPKDKSLDAFEKANETAHAENEALLNELLERRKKEECANMWAGVLSAANPPASGGSFGDKYAKAVNAHFAAKRLREQYNAKCQTAEQNKAYNERR